MKLQDGEHVKWIGENGGWCMGHVQTTEDGSKFVEADCGLLRGPVDVDDVTLVKHTLTGDLEFVVGRKLQRIPLRSEWEQDAKTATP